MTANHKVEFENERVRVTRVKSSGPGTMPPAKRADRMIIYLSDAGIKRKEKGRVENHKRRAGEVVWRAASEHEVEVTHDGEHEVLIVELKK